MPSDPQVCGSDSLKSIARQYWVEAVIVAALVGPAEQ